ncbi:MAG: glycoside hydrolase domain-containing protein [Bacteroidales bacterium]
MKAHSIVLILASILFLYSCADYKKDITFEYVDPLQKIFPESSYFPAQKAHADVARGEHASFQFAVRSGLTLEDVQLEVTSPIAGNTKLEDIKTGFVGYVPVDRPVPSPGRDYLKSSSGFYPDPILDSSSVDIPSTMTQAVWLSVAIPKDTEPGKYAGQVTLQAKIKGQKVYIKKDISIEVYKPIIDKTSLMVTNWYNPDNLNLLNKDGKLEKYSNDYWKYMATMGKMMKEYRQNVVLISPTSLTDYKKDGDKWHFDFSNFNKTIKLMIEAGCCELIEGGHIGTRLPENWTGPFVVRVPEKKDEKWEMKDYNVNAPKAQNFYKQFLPALKKNLEENKWLNMYCQHIADEPIGTNKESYAEISAFARKFLPGVRIIEACHSSDLDGSIDIWVPQLNFLNDDYSFYKKQQEQGKEVWFYTCLGPQENFANRFIEQPLIKTRLLHWINYNYGITGYLHWGLNYWQKDSDPYKETTHMNYAGNTLPAGDMNIVYPAENRLLSSIRLEAMRDGIVDYELLKMLDKKNPELAKKLAGKIVFNFDHYDLSISNFRTMRKTILEELSK